VIQSIRIDNYRGIRSGLLQDLPRIAVLTGPNGCGKSSVLEAVEIGSTSPTSPLVVVPRWDYQSTPFRWLVGRGVDGAASILVTWRDRLWIQSGFEVRAETVTTACEDPAGLATTRAAVFIEQRPGRPRPALHSLFTNCRIRGGAEAAVAILRDVDPTIRGLEILTQGESPVLHIVYQDRTVPAGLAGDGMGALVRLALELTQQERRTCLLEEPEAHQHSAAILRSAQAIAAAARLESQVILATHSLEFIDDLLSALKDDELDYLAVYRLRLAQGVLKVQRVPGAEVNAARTAIGDDLR
jgi:hypothetical protein